MSTEDEPPAERVWASQWYQVTPRSFEQIELLFDPERVIYAFAGESYKSFLLRRDGREDRAHDLGLEYRDQPAESILADERHEATPVDALEEIRFRSGSLLRKPKLAIATADDERTFYHPSRGQSVASLAETLAALYPSVPVRVDGERKEAAPTRR